MGSGRLTSVDSSLVTRLALTEVARDRFRGAPGLDPHHLYGGQLVAQGLAAATRTTAETPRPHSLHANFLQAGTGDLPIEYEVERIRDGGSFATRRIVGTQNDAPIFLMTVSFQRAEGEELHQPEMAAWAGTPTGLAPGRYDSPEVDCRDQVTPATDGVDPLSLGHWVRARHRLPDDQVTHDVALAWISDKGPTRAARRPHLDHPGFERRQTTSLSHTVWFHGPGRADGWMFTELISTATAGSRGLVRGTIHDEAGRLLLSLGQEVLVRLG